MTSEEMKARLAELEAEKDRLAAEREARNAEALLLERLEAAEQEVKDAAALAEAESEHGPSYVSGEEDPGTRKLAVIKTSLGTVILRRADPITFKKFISAQKANEETFFNLVKPSIVYPTKARFDSMYEDQPAILARCANAVAEMAGARTKEIAGKA